MTKPALHSALAGSEPRASTLSTERVTAMATATCRDERAARGRSLLPFVLAWPVSRSRAEASSMDFDLVFPFDHMDTLDSSRNRLWAGRLWGEFVDEDSSWSGRIGSSLLSSRNRNFLDRDEINRTSGRRFTLDAQLQRQFKTAAIEHRLILVLDHESEEFKASDVNFGGATDQDRDRKHNSLTFEWRADAGPVTADLALRRDLFNRFKDATTVRASLLADVGHGFSIAASYGEGIAQPTFFDLYGFFPNSFVGNPSLKPECSRGFEASIRYRKDSIGASLTAYRQRLRDEIVDVFDPATFLSSTENRSERSRRSGIEAQVDYAFGDQLRLSANYAYLKATEPGDSSAKRAAQNTAVQLLPMAKSAA